jgi:hypothetical protein
MRVLAAAGRSAKLDFPSMMQEFYIMPQMIPTFARFLFTFARFLFHRATMIQSCNANMSHIMSSQSFHLNSTIQLPALPQVNNEKEDKLTKITNTAVESSAPDDHALRHGEKPWLRGNADELRSALLQRWSGAGAGGEF